MQPPHSSTSGAQRWAPGRQALPHFSPGQEFFHLHCHSEPIQGQNDFSYSEREFVVPTRCLGHEIQVARLCYSAWQGFKWCVSKLPTELQNYTELRQGSRGRERRWRVKAQVPHPTSTSATPPTAIFASRFLVCTLFHCFLIIFKCT